MRPVAPARLAAADPGFDKAFVGFTDPNRQSVETQPANEEKWPQASGPAPRAPEIPRGILVKDDHEDRPEPDPRIIPNLPGPARESAGAFTPAPPEPAPGKARFLERIEIFRNWLAKNFQATDIFILDREGKVIFDESGHGRLHFMARNLALASRHTEAQGGNVHVKIGPAAVLEVIPCETPYGRIVLGALVPESLPAPHVRTITEVLVQTASPG